MWIAVLFIIISWLVIALAFFKARGLVIGVFIMIVALGFAVVALPFIPQNNPIQYPQITVITSSGNIVIQPFSSTSSPTAQTQSFGFVLGEVNAIVESGLTLFMVGMLFYSDKKIKEEKYNN